MHICYVAVPLPDKAADRLSSGGRSFCARSHVYNNFAADATTATKYEILLINISDVGAMVHKHGGQEVQREEASPGAARGTVIAPTVRVILL